MEDFENNNIKLQTQYWFSNLASIRFGLGAKLGCNSGDIRSVTLLTSIRF